MAIYHEDIISIELNSGNIHRSFARHSIGSGDSAANRFGIRVLRGGEEVDLTGCSCYGYFRDPRGNNIALTSNGTVNGAVAYVTLPQACYNYEGQFCLSIKLIGGGVTGTMRIVDGVVDNTNTGSAVAPTSTVPTYSEILSQYDAMVAATAAANGCIAETFDATKPYSAGKFVINSGALYVLTADHAANTTWADTTKVGPINFGDQLSDVKSAIDDLIETSANLLDPSKFIVGKYLVNGGGLDTNSNLTASGFFPVSGNTTYYMYRSDTYQVRVAYYTTNAESGYISMDSGISATTPGFTTPATAQYARLSTNKNMIKDMGVYTTNIGYYIPYKVYLADDISIEKHIDATLKVAGKAADAKAVGEIAKYIIVPEKCCKYGDTTMHIDERLDFDTGGVVTNSTNNCRSDYIPVSVGDNVITASVRDIMLYEDDFSYIGYINLWNSSPTPPSTWSGNYRYNLTTIETMNNKTPSYIRIYGKYDQYLPGVTVLSSDDYEIVNLADSIFGNNEKPFDLGTYIQNITGLKNANCAYGGTTARVIPSGNMSPLGLPSLVDCIVSGDYSSLQTPSYWASKSEYMYAVPTQLFPLIDFSKVKIITIAYGTNDYNSNTPLDNENNAFDTSTYCGGLRYAIKNLLQKYPNITIILLSPIYRYWSDSADYSTVDRDSDSRENTLNLKLIDYVNAMQSVADEYHVPFFNNYNGFGLNQYTAPTWLRDGTHLTRTTGVEKLGHTIAKEISEVY